MNQAELHKFAQYVNRAASSQGAFDDNSAAKDILANAEACAAADVTDEAHLAYGDVTEAVLETASATPSSWGRAAWTGLKRLMIGSISNAVAAKSLLPVMIVKRFLVA